MHRAWGASGEKSSHGRIVEGVRRSTFVLDEQGVITQAFYNTEARGHLDMLDQRLAFRS